MIINSKNYKHQSYGFTMRLQARLLIILLLFIACSKIPVLKIDFTAEEEITRTTRQQAFDLTRIYHQVTTHPEIDAYPAISPDRQWVAFSSRRSGNMDIWIKPVKGGSAIPITSHRADDIMPCWSPDSKKIAFVSYREDAAGDIWIVPIKKRREVFSLAGNPEKLTRYLGMDVTPAFSPDGKYIAFTSDRDGEQNIYVYQLRNKKIFRITEIGAIHPTWSPDGRRIGFVSFHNNPLNKGQIFYVELSFKSTEPVVTATLQVTSGQSNDAFPCWSSIRDEVYFSRYEIDTNGDGQITPDDKPGVWKVIVENKTDSQIISKQSNKKKDDEQVFEVINRQQDQSYYFQEIQLIPTFYHDFFPVCGSDSLLYFVSHRSGNDDIWSIHNEGVIPRQDDGFLQYQFALNYFPLPANDLVFKPAIGSNDLERNLYRLLAFQRVIDFFPEENIWIGWALYEIGRTYIALNQFDLATAYFHEITNQFIDFPDLVGKAKLRLFEIDYLDGNNNFDDQINYLQEIANQFQNRSEIVAEAQLFMGEVYLLSKNYSQAIEQFEQLITIFPDEEQKCALAQLFIGDIYKKFGQTDEVIHAFIRVFENYPDQDALVDSALNRILSLPGDNDFYEVISNYRNIIAQYGQYQRLSARTQFRIGQQFFDRDDYDAAIEELSLVTKNYPDQRGELAQAELMLAAVYYEKGEDLRAINQYKKVIQEFGDVQGGLFVVQAKEQLLDIYLQTGRQYRVTGDIKAANIRYRDAITIFPRHLDAHRGYVATMYALKRIDEAILLYQNLLSTNRDDEIVLYVLGLCYSYKATEISDRTKNIELLDINYMKKSNELIQQALSKNYRLIPAYLTLSYNYESIEKHESALRAKDRSFVVSLIQTAVAPIKSFVNWLTFRKEKTPEQWYEQAIDALTTAIALNDEQQNPTLESELALNLAGNYYNLGEFGFEQAYKYYKEKIKYDSTFTSNKLEADVYKRMGHCAVVVEDFEQGPAYLERAINLYKDLNDTENWLINIKRLALLYQLTGDYDQSAEYFKIAAEEDSKKNRFNQQAAAYRSIAYNYQMLNDDEEAIRYAQQALDLIRNGKVKEVKAKPNWIKIGILGIEFPVWNLGQIGAGASTAAEGFTTDEERAFIYSIMGQAALGQRSIPAAIHYLNKKIAIYRNRKDRIAEAIFLNNIGYLYYWDLNYIKAWEYFERSLKICKREHNTPGMLINILNLASLGVIMNKSEIVPINSSTDTSHQVLKSQATKYLTSSLEHLQFGLSLYENELIGFLYEKVQLYNLSGNLHYLKNAYVPDSLQHDQVYVMQQQIDRLEDLAIADSCFQNALSIARGNNFQIGEIIILQNLGYLALDLGDISYALEQFNKARELSIKQNLLSWLWRIDCAIGQVYVAYNDSLGQVPSKRDANFYLNEAISVVEQNVLQLGAFRTTPFYKFQIRILYRTAIDYNISLGKYIHALRLTEQYRGKQYLDMIGSYKLELKKERHKIFLGNARFLTQEMNNLDNKIRLAKEQKKGTDPEILNLMHEKRKLQNDYAQLLEELKEEDPELESFIYVEPVTFVQIQNILDKNSIAVNYFLSDEKLYFWTITSDSVNFVEVPFQEKEFEKQINDFTSNLSNYSNSDQAIESIWQILIQPIANQIDSFKNVIIIPDGSINRIPFSYLINFSFPEYQQFKNVIIVPNLSNYYYSYQKRKIRSAKILFAGGDFVKNLESLGYSIKNIILENNVGASINTKLKDDLQSGELIYLDIKFSSYDNDPLLSAVVLHSLKNNPTFQVRDIYDLDLQCSLIILNGIQDGGILSLLALQKALLYAGAPSLIISLWDTNDNTFWEYFFDALLDYSAGDAFLRVQLQMQKAGFDPYFYAGYQFIGFEGMNDEQELQFAEERFVSTVRRGNKDVENKKWNDAIAEYEQALIMAKKRGDILAINNLYQYIIETSTSGGFYDKAIVYQLEALESARANNDIQKIADSYAYLVLFYTENKNYDQAVFYQNEYLKLIEEYDLKPQMANSYRNLGLVYERGENFEKALNNFLKAIEIYHEIGDSTNVANCLKDRGRIYLMKLDNYSKAIENQEQALKIYQAQQNMDGTLEIFQNLGLSHERLANYQAALEYQSQALKLAEQLGNSYWIALSKHLLANVFWKMGNYEQALRSEKQAQQIFAELNNKKFQSVGLATEGLILMSLGNLDDAIIKEQQALELAKEINDRPDMATIHKNLGLIYRAQNRWNEALEQFQQAIHIDELINSKRGLGYGYRDIGSIYLQQGRTVDALGYFHQALKISKAIYDGRNEVQCLYEIGKTYLFLENMKAALDTLNLAADKAQQLFIPEVEWRSRRLIGQLYGESNNLEQSINAYYEALEVIENMRSQIKVEEYKAGFIDDKLDVYYDLVDLYLQLKLPGKALEIVERAKSRNFIDLLANRDIKFSGKVSEETLSQGKNIQNEIRRIQNEVSNLIVKGANITVSEQERLNRLNDHLQDLKQTYQKFLIELKQQNTELAEMVTVTHANVDLLESIIPDSVIILEYFYTENKLYTWTLTNKQINSKQTNFEATDLTSQVELFRTALQEQKPIFNISQHLYNLLIKPFESAIEHQNHIVIIPHGILHYLPFAALLDNSQQYLIEKYSISLAPSAAVLNICMNKGQYFLSAKEWTPQILAMGNPDLNMPQFELPFAEKEIESVQLFYPDVTSYLNNHATETTFKQSCDAANMILLSCHGEFDAANPLFSSLLLTADEANDGRLTAHEIFGLNMNTYLVAMSACETGLAKISVGDEVVGLSRSFIYAGSSSLLSSLWKVDDLATAVMIKRFFRYLKEGDSRARALQKAINLVRTQINVHPVYWAAFNITGDFR